MSIHDVLGSDGLFSEKLSNFKARDVQLQLAEKIQQTIHDSGTLIAEAGTGTGKTFAYLVPLLLEGKKSIISTGTKNLQEQLFKRDLPEVMKIMGLKPKIRLLKGRSNYLCHHKFYKALHSKLNKHPEMGLELKLINEWSFHTETGDISELTSVPESSQVWRHATSTAESCIGMECPEFNQCQVFKARKKALDADVLVVNHHLLFADMAIKQGGFGELLPKAEVIILDEAHQIPETASRFFGQSLSSHQIKELVDDLTKEAGEVTGAYAVISDSLQWLNNSLRDLHLQFSTAPKSETLQHLLQVSANDEMIDLLKESLQDLRAVLEPISVQSAGLSSALGRVDLQINFIAELLKNDESNFVYWYEKRDHYFIFFKTPIDIADPLSEFREENQASWILTSATLSVNRDFSHFKEETGLLESESIQLDSPFDYEKNALLYLPKTLPNPQDLAFTQTMIKNMLPIIEANKGGVFFLFTTHRALKLAANYYRQYLNKPLFVQGEGGRHQILADFRKSKNGVLLGAASFWEGVDVQGDSLSCVIIDKLPFANPDTPLLQARFQNLQDNGKNPFADYSLPKAILTLKQGVGRLIRSESDKGLLVICDKRITQKFYGKKFINSLPKMKITSELNEVLETLKQQ